MKKIFISFFVFGLVFLSAPLYLPSNSSSVFACDTCVVPTGTNSPGFSADEADFISSTTSRDGTLFVAYTDYANQKKATVMKYYGGNWLFVGTPGFSAGEAWTSSIAVDSKDVPYVAYTDYANGHKVTVMKFDGGNWVPVGISGPSAISSFATKLIIGDDDALYVSYVDDPNSTTIFVDKFNGKNWVPVGAPVVPSGFPGEISFKIGKDNTLYLSYTENFGVNSFRIKVMKFDGSNWIYFPDIPEFSSQRQISPSLAISSDNIPYVAYTGLYLSPTIESKAFTVRFDGTTWSPVGEPIPMIGLNDVLGISLALNSNNVPYLAFSDGANSYKTTVMKFDDTNWIPVGNAGFSDGFIEFLSLSIDSENDVYVVFSDGAHGYKASAMKIQDEAYWANL